MSIETVPSNVNAFNDFEESVSERRVRLHLELAINTQELHKLETEHSQRIMGLLTTKNLLDTFNLDCHRQAQGALSTRQQELAKIIAQQRQEQARLITEISHCNTTIWRPAYDDGKFDHHRSNKQARGDIERPYVQEIYKHQDLLLDSLE
jgi:hypothetical protein